MNEPLQHSTQLAMLRDLRQTTRNLYRREAASICDYLVEQPGRTVVARNITDGVDDLLRSPDPTEHSTCTAFVVALLTERPSDTRGPSPERHFLGERTDAVIQTILSDFTALYVGISDGARASAELEQVKATADLPNWYNTPMHLSGVTAAIRSAGGVDSVPAGTVELGADVATQIAAWLRKHRGFVPDIAEDSTRNPYLTYWCVRSLTEWSDLWPASAALLAKTLDLALEANLDYLARILVANDVGIGSAFDAPDLVCTLGVVALASRQLRRRDEFIDTVLPRAVNVLFSSYVHVDGSFAPNQAVLVMAPRRGRSAIVVSSEELNAILIHALGADLEPQHAVGLKKALNHAARKASGPRGWGGAAATSPDRRPAFAAAGALAFLRGYHDTLDRLISQLCAAELGVVPYGWDPGLDDFEMPRSVAGVIHTRVVDLIKNKRRRDLAVMSMVLSGPSTGVKEMIARKVAHELKWPIVVFDPASFLQEDGDSVVRHVSWIVDLVSELSDTVVFLDCLDDMVDGRGRRLLTWSMIRRIGARGMVLLIIASSSPGEHGLTDRFGNVANIYAVSPPDDEERTTLLEQFLDRYGAPDDVVEAFATAEVAGHTNGLSEGHLLELVRICVGQRLATGTFDVQAVERALQSLIHGRGAGEGGS